MHARNTYPSRWASRRVVVPTATVTAVTLALTACSSGDDNDEPSFNEQRTGSATDTSTPVGTPLPSEEPEEDDEELDSYLDAGERVNVGWATAWQGSETPFTFDEGYVYDVTVSNPRIFTETIAANPKAPSDHPDSQESDGETIACYDLSGTNFQEYERAVLSTGRYSIQIKGKVADHLTPEPATDEDVAEITKEFTLMGEGPTQVIEGTVPTGGRSSDVIRGGEFRPLGTDTYEQYDESDRPVDPLEKTGTDPNIVETNGDGDFKVSRCSSLGEGINERTAPTSLLVELVEPGYSDGFLPDTEAKGWKIDL